MDYKSLARYCEVLDQVRQTRSRNAKTELLQRANEDRGMEEWGRFLWRVAMDTYFPLHTTVPKDALHRKGTFSSVADTTIDLTTLEELVTCLHHRTLTGNAAKTAVGTLVAAIPDESVRFWLFNFLNKNVVCGVGHSTILDIWPNLFKVFTVALCDTYEKGQDLSSGYCVSPKLDGMRCLIFYRNGEETVALSRNGKPISNVDHVLAEVNRVCSTLNFKAGIVLDGEILSTCNTWSKTVSLAHSNEGTEDESHLVYHVFDVILMDEYQSGRFVWAKEERDAIRSHICAVSREQSDVLHYVEEVFVNNHEDLERVTQEYLNRGYEGSVLKRVGSVYPAGRSADWLKYKPVYTEDVTVIGIVESKCQSRSDRPSVESLTVLLPNGRTCSVGTGMTNEQRYLWMENPDLIVGKTIEVKYQSYTPIISETEGGVLLFPRLFRVREDK